MVGSLGRVMLHSVPGSAHFPTSPVAPPASVPLRLSRRRTRCTLLGLGLVERFTKSPLSSIIPRSGPDGPMPPRWLYAQAHRARLRLGNRNLNTHAALAGQR